MAGKISPYGGGGGGISTEEHKILSKNQIGFRYGFRTSDHIRVLSYTSDHIRVVFHPDFYYQ